MSTGNDPYGPRRAAMVEYDLAARGIHDARVLRAMARVPRERFVLPAERRDAYADSPLPIGSGQTISQPFIVALMSEALQLAPGDRVLEIGTGSGYAAAVLAELAQEVWTIERHRPLADRATAVLADLGYGNVHVVCGDGTLGWPDAAPYDAIVATAGGPQVPSALRAQMADGGRLVMPVGPSDAQRLVRVRRRGDAFTEDDLGGVRFVPLIGAQGWRTGEPG